MSRHHHPIQYPNLSARIAELDLSHAKIAAAAGCATPTISRIVRGHLVPSASLKLRIALRLGRPVDELFVAAADRRAA